MPAVDVDGPGPGIHPPFTQDPPPIAVNGSGVVQPLPDDGVEPTLDVLVDAGTPPVVKLQTGPAAVMFAIVFETICQ